jgi:hypothetical protein
MFVAAPSTMQRGTSMLLALLIGWVTAAGAATPESLLMECANGGWPAQMREPSLKVQRVGNPIGDEKVRFGGVVPVLEGDVVDPAVSGLWLVVTDHLVYHGSSHTTFVDAAAPAGAGWRANANGTHWRYRAPAGGDGGIRRASVKEVAAKPAWGLRDRAYRVRVTLEPAAFASQTDLEPHWVALGFGSDESTDVCSTRLFYPRVIDLSDLDPTIPPWVTPSFWAQCHLSANGAGLACRPPARVGPCRVGDPEDLVLCDALGAGAAQEAHRDRTGSYFEGPCDEIPGFRGSPEVTCSASANGASASVLTSHPQMGMNDGCRWSSESEPNLSCF